MTPCIFSCTWLLPFVVLATLSTGELEFYQGAMPEIPDVALNEVARYIEAQGHKPALRSYPSTLFSRLPKKHNLKTERDILWAFAVKSGIADMVREYFESEDAIPREYDNGYYGANSMPKTIGEYINLKLPLPVDNAVGMKEGPEYAQSIVSAKDLPYNEAGIDGGMKEETMSDFRGGLAKIRDDEELGEEDVGVLRLPSTIPDFTFKFNDAKLDEELPFAVKPNDPRYYEKVPFLTDTNESDLQKASRSASEEGNDQELNGEPEILQRNPDTETVMFQKLKDLATVPVPEHDRRSGYHPSIVPVNHSLNNDIYFIAIVAGCSAAVMFALVLISLTWCRLQRGVKAAADIEYPAYGVTGPNKDVSPSGDQRLAQSAQMYHFQHQKQQIIAMENRTSATRDPGSVSEAESDEENEEGDYTVYECPGLASTGEMEVKNPLFHDDPTPATPAQTNTDEDHM